MTGPALLTCSAREIRAWSRGYALASRTAGRNPVHLLLSWAVNLFLMWTIAVLLLWFAVDIFSRNLTGDPVSKVVVSKGAAWRRSLGWDQ